MSVIELKCINKFFGEQGSRQHVLKDVSMRIEDGEMVAIMGPSGSGKSTLLNILGLLEIPESGDYNIGERDIRQLKEKEQAYYRNEKIGFVFQNFNLLNELSALENVRLNIQFHNLHSKRKIRAKEMIKRSKEVLALMGLSEHLQKRPAELSGGQQQRVAIARAIANHPEFILADEPTGALDSKTAEEIMQVFKDLNEMGNTVIIVTHNAEVARQCDRIIYMKDGVLTDDI